MREGVKTLHYFPYTQEIPAALMKFYFKKVFLEANFFSLSLNGPLCLRHLTEVSSNLSQWSLLCIQTMNTKI